MFRFITSSTSWFSTRLRVQLVAHANIAVSPKPSSTNARMMRLRSCRRKRVRLRAGAGSSAAAIRSAVVWRGDAVADAMAGLDQRNVERLVDDRTQAVDVHAQAVRIGQFLAPHAGFQLLARDDGRR